MKRSHRVIPVLLLHNGGLVKSVRFSKYQYVGDPINAVKIFNEKEVDEIVLLDIDASRNSREPNYSLIKEIVSEAFIPLAYGGGIRSLDQIKQLISSGVEKVILNKAAVEFPELVQEASNYVGSQSVVVSIDVKRNIWGKSRVVTNNGKHITGWDPVSFAKHMETLGAGELLINSVDRDGTYKGYDLELIHAISNSVDIPVVICGGASDLNDFRMAINHGATAVAAGSMFVFQRPHQAVLISYPSQEELKNNLFKYLPD